MSLQKVCLILVILLSTISLASADGMIHVYDPDMQFLKLQKENRQLCVVNYENGFENMVLAVDVYNLDKKAVWIFPIPATPNNVTVDLIDGFPEFHGYDVKKRVDEKISIVFNAMRLSQIYTIPFVMFGMFSMSKSMEEVIIHKHVEKMGLTVELVTTENGSTLYDYLINKGLNLPANSKSILDDYVGKNYSFVISWISDFERFERESVIGVYVAFPTNKIYFPLKPTSVYDELEIPILIYVIGYVTPKLYPEIEKDVQVNYFVQSHYSVPDQLSHLFNGKTKIKDLKYTKIKIYTPSKNLVEDLWIDCSILIDVVLAEFVNNSAWVWGTMLFVLSSCLASMFAGTIVFRKDNPDRKKFALFGLWNFLSLIGFAFMTMFLKTKKLEPELEKLLESHAVVIWDDRKILFVFLFSVFFVILTLIFEVVLHYIF